MFRVLVITLLLTGCGFGLDNGCAKDGTSVVDRATVEKKAWTGSELTLSLAAKQTTTVSKTDKKQDECKQTWNTVDISAEALDVEVYLCRGGKLTHVTGTSGRELVVPGFDAEAKEPLVVYSGLSRQMCTQYAGAFVEVTRLEGKVTAPSEDVAAAFETCRALVDAAACGK